MLRHKINLPQFCYYSLNYSVSRNCPNCLLLLETKRYFPAFSSNSNNNNKKESGGFPKFSPAPGGWGQQQQQQQQDQTNKQTFSSSSSSSSRWTSFSSQKQQEKEQEQEEAEQNKQKISIIDARKPKSKTPQGFVIETVLFRLCTTTTPSSSQNNNNNHNNTSMQQYSYNTYNNTTNAQQQEDCFVSPSNPRWIPLAQLVRSLPRTMLEEIYGRDQHDFDKKMNQISSRKQGSNSANFDIAREIRVREILQRQLPFSTEVRMNQYTNSFETRTRPGSDELNEIGAIVTTLVLFSDANNKNKTIPAEVVIKYLPRNLVSYATNRHTSISRCLLNVVRAVPGLCWQLVKISVSPSPSEASSPLLSKSSSSSISKQSQGFEIMLLEKEKLPPIDLVKRIVNRVQLIDPEGQNILASNEQQQDNSSSTLLDNDNSNNNNSNGNNNPAWASAWDVTPPSDSSSSNKTTTVNSTTTTQQNSSSNNFSLTHTDLLPFIPTYFIPMSRVLKQISAQGYTQYHLEEFFGKGIFSPTSTMHHRSKIDSFNSTKNPSRVRKLINSGIQIVSLPRINNSNFGSNNNNLLANTESESYVRIFGNNNGIVDLMPILETNTKFEQEFSPFYGERAELVNQFLYVLHEHQKEQQQQQQNNNNNNWMHLTTLLQIVGKSIERLLPYQGGQESLLFFAQLQHLFMFSTQNGGMICLRNNIHNNNQNSSSLYADTTPSPFLYNQVVRKITSAMQQQNSNNNGLMSLKEMESSLHPLAMKELQICFGNQLDSYYSTLNEKAANDEDNDNDEVDKQENTNNNNNNNINNSNNNGNTKSWKRFGEFHSEKIFIGNISATGNNNMDVGGENEKNDGKKEEGKENLKIGTISAALRELQKGMSSQEKLEVAIQSRRRQNCYDNNKFYQQEEDQNSSNNSNVQGKSGFWGASNNSNNNNKGSQEQEEQKQQNSQNNNNYNYNMPVNVSRSYIKSLKHKVAAEKSAESPLFRDKAKLAAAISEYLPLLPPSSSSSSEQNQQQQQKPYIRFSDFLKQIPSDLKDLVPRRVGMLRFLHRFPQHFCFFDLHYPGNAHVQRSGIPKPVGALRNDFSEADMIRLIVQQLQRVHQATSSIVSKNNNNNNSQHQQENENDVVGVSSGLPIKKLLVHLPTSLRSSFMTINRSKLLIEILEKFPESFSFRKVHSQNINISPENSKNENQQQQNYDLGETVVILLKIPEEEELLRKCS